MSVTTGSEIAEVPGNMMGFEELLGMPHYSELKLEVQDSSSTSFSEVYLSQNVMAEHVIWYFDSKVLLGKDGLKTACTLVTDSSDDAVADDKIKINSVIRGKLGVSVGDSVTVLKNEKIPFCKKVCLWPFEEILQDLESVDLFQAYLVPYFMGVFRLLNKDDILSITTWGGRQIKFQVTHIEASPFCIVGPGTIIECNKKVQETAALKSTKLQKAPVIVVGPALAVPSVAPAPGLMKPKILSVNTESCRKSLGKPGRVETGKTVRAEKNDHLGSSNNKTTHESRGSLVQYDGKSSQIGVDTDGLNMDQYISEVPLIPPRSASVLPVSAAAALDSLQKTGKVRDRTMNLKPSADSAKRLQSSIAPIGHGHEGQVQREVQQRKTISARILQQPEERRQEQQLILENNPPAFVLRTSIRIKNRAAAAAAAATTTTGHLESRRFSVKAVKSRRTSEKSAFIKNLKKNESKVNGPSHAADFEPKLPSTTINSKVYTNDLNTENVQTSIFRTKLIIPEMGHFHAVAYNVSHNSLKGTLFPDSPVQVVGRISPETVWDYIDKIKNTKEVIVFRLAPASEADSQGYMTFFSYLSSRGRFGVLGGISPPLKDVYLIPINNHLPIHRAIHPNGGPGIPKKRKDCLLAVVIRHIMDFSPTIQPKRKALLESAEASSPTTKKKKN